MNIISYKNFLLIFVFAIYATNVSAERYPDDAKEAFALENLVKVLIVQHHELGKLMNMLGRLDKWKKILDQENTRLSQEGELAKADRKKLENGQMSEDELNRKWRKSGRSLKHQADIKLFTEDVAKFNSFAEEYNQLTKKMNHVLEKRSPGKVAALVGEMKKLIHNLQANLKKGDIAKAKFIARQSEIAAEFGYQAR